MIFGIGTDIVNLERIKNLDSLERFAKKILSEGELEEFKSLTDEKKYHLLQSSLRLKKLFLKH